ncbi:SDR family NAD(P)-dependent oxidoreductase [Pseudonocardia sp. 73-21]|uniref:SDR family NAD(P)-dependent oxidoreductase n=1 Tax=Pseudonocardia sp. 73-21 TaxID=1895809 RepID=UPI00095A6BFA|nr:SDR family NAD(P)-dependent oxidoreductase [Pseudonocardia sp. 73-21]OJY38848.1 MAG: hypothetical protein BGP03_28510 [Pseudonocardia sp. 73-21]
MDLGLAERTVLVTGGSGGIGRRMVARFAAEGARVAFTYRAGKERAEVLEKEIREAGGEALAVPMDLTDPGSTTAAVDTVAPVLGPVEVLVVNASATGGPAPHPVDFVDVPAATWVPQLRTEIEGAFHTVQAVLPGMCPGGWGRIVFMSASIVDRGRRGEQAYTAGKSALHGLNRSLATELASAGVLCNVVAPGPTITEGLLPKLPPALRAAIDGRPPREARALLDEGMPHLAFSTVDDVVNVVLFLASAANGNVTGSVLNVAGGR